MTDWVRQAPLPVFFFLAFVFTWSLLPVAATSISVSLVALCGPAAAATVVAFILGKEAVCDLFGRIKDWRVPIGWYILAIILPIPVTLVRSLVEQLLTSASTVQFQPISLLSLIVFILVLGEEIGWRGFALPRLLPRYGPFWASVLIGVLWAFWHLPLFYMPSMPQYGGPFPAFIIYTISLSIILTWLSLGTRGSLIIATLFHGAVNTLGFVNPAAGPELRGWSKALCYGIAALILALLMRRTLLKTHLGSSSKNGQHIT